MNNKFKFVYVSFFLLSVTSLLACVPEKRDKGVRAAATFFADTEYLKECKAITSLHRHDQVDFLGILAGSTTAKEVETLLGSPLDSSKYLENKDWWTYDGFAIILEENIVESIYVDGDSFISIGLEDILSKYGCPSLLFAMNPAPHPSGPNYENTEFIYYETGVEFHFRSFPVSLFDTPRSIFFFNPQNLEGYLEESKKGYFHPNVGMPVSWEDAVK